MKSFLKLFVMFVLFSSIQFAQTGTRMVGFNANSLGRGGTSIGYFDSPELMMTNPAGISFIKNNMLDVNLSLMFPSLHFQNNLNNADGEKNIFPLPGIAYINKNNNSNLTWGLGFFTSGGMGADFKLKHALYREQNGNFTLQDYHSKLASMQGGISVAYLFNENLSVGLSLHAVYSMLEFWMPYSLNPLVMKGIAQPQMTFGQMFAAPSSVGGFGYSELTASAKMSELTAFAFNAKLGLAYKVDENLSLGFSYTLPTSVTYKNGKAAMDMSYQLNEAFGKAVQGVMMQNPGMTAQQAQAAVMTMFSQMGIDLSKGVIADYNLDVELTFPQSIGFGIAYKPAEEINLLADIELISWENAFDKMVLKLSNGSNSNINKMIGSSGLNIDFPMNWKNQVLIKLGAEYFVSENLALRLGYANGANPVPESTVFPIFPAVVENHITGGLSYKISESIKVNGAFELGLNNSVVASKPSLIASEYSGSTSELSTLLFHVGFNYSF